MAVLEQQDVPRTEVMITSVGSEIYTLDENGVSYVQDHDWLHPDRRQLATFRPSSACCGRSRRPPQAPLEQRDFKLSYFSDGTHATIER